MINHIFAIYDSKVEAYNRPFYAQTVQEAKTMVAQSAKSPESMLHQYPADYTLFRLGEFDDQTGSITMLKAYENLGNIISVASTLSRTLTLEEELAQLNSL